MPSPIALTFDRGNASKMLSSSIRGADDLERALNELTSDLRRRVVRAALRDAAKPIVKSARDYAKPRDFSSKRRVAGTMRRAINVFSSKKYKGANGTIGVYISVKASRAVLKKRPVSGDPFYWRFVEGGHKVVPRRPGFAVTYSKRQLRAAGLSITQRRSLSRGQVMPYPFLAPAFKAASGEALRIFQQAIYDRIEKANRRK